MRLLIATVAAFAIVAAPAQAHDLTCSTHQSEVRKVSKVAGAGGQCIRKGTNYVRYAKAYGRYVAHQDVRLIGGDSWFGLHVTVKFRISGVWWTSHG